MIFSLYSFLRSLLRALFFAQQKREKAQKRKEKVQKKTLLFYGVIFGKNEFAIFF